MRKLNASSRACLSTSTTALYDAAASQPPRLDDAPLPEGLYVTESTSAPVIVNAELGVIGDVGTVCSQLIQTALRESPVTCTR